MAGEQHHLEVAQGVWFLEMLRSHGPSPPQPQKISIAWT